MKILTKFLLLWLLSGVAGQASEAVGLAQNITLVNPGFEAPNLNGAWSYLSSPTGNTTNGWTFLTTGGGAGIASGGSPWVAAAPEGKQAAFLQGSVTLSQNFNVAQTGNYYIYLLAANRPNYPADNLAVQIDNVTVGYCPSTLFSGGNFISLTTNLTLSAGAHVLSLVGSSPGGDTALAVDDISIQPQSFSMAAPNVFQTDGSDASVQQAINTAGNGAKILLPAGNFSWKNGVSVSGKAITIVGAGAGALFGNSTTPVSVGLGSKSFVVNVSPDSSKNGSGYVPVTAGATVTAYYTASGDFGSLMGNSPTNMTGTVTSFDGTNLVLNVTSFQGGGGQGFWTFGTASSTVITNFCTGGPAFDLYEPGAGNVELSGVRVIASGANSAIGNAVNIEDGGGLALLHDCWFSVANVGARAIEVRANHGIIYRCSFDNKFDAGVNHNGNGNNDGGVTFKPINLTSSWEQNSTMGTDDIGGTNNFYVEDCYEAGFWTGGTDFDDNSRVVFRHCVFDNSVASSHGEETSPYGVRHFELYNNTFLFTDVGLASFNLNWWLFLRGGTGVIFSNAMPNIISQTWGDKMELTFDVMYPYRDGCVTNYPAPHQIGQSVSNGVSIIDPVYFWANAGLPANNPGIQGYTPGQYDSCYSVNGYPAGKPDQTNAPPISWYLQPGREYTNTVKVGYVPFTYPHPLRSTASAKAPGTSSLSPPQLLRAAGT